MLLRYHTHTIQIRRRRNHRFRTRTVLRIHQNHVGSRILQRSNAFVDAQLRKSSGSTDRIASTVPVCQMTKVGLFASISLTKLPAVVLSGFLGLYFYGNVNRELPAASPAAPPANGPDRRCLPTR